MSLASVRALKTWSKSKFVLFSRWKYFSISSLAVRSPRAFAFGKPKQISLLGPPSLRALRRKNKHRILTYALFTKPTRGPNFSFLGVEKCLPNNVNVFVTVWCQTISWIRRQVHDVLFRKQICKTFVRLIPHLGSTRLRGYIFIQPKIVLDVDLEILSKAGSVESCILADIKPHTKFQKFKQYFFYKSIMVAQCSGS